MIGVFRCDTLIVLKKRNEMSKIKVILSALILTMLLAGCSSLDEITVSEADKYESLSTLITNPVNPMDSDVQNLSGDFTFSAYTLSESETWDLDDESKNIVVAMISRNVDGYLLISVDNIEDFEFEEGIYLSVTASLAGSIYWTVDNKQVEVLHVEASKVEPLTFAEVDPVEDASFSVTRASRSGVLTFKEAQSTNVVRKPGMNLYFDFKNTSEQSISPFFSGLMVYQGDTLLSPTVLNGDAELKPDALNYSVGNEAHAGKTNFYYAIFQAKYDDEEMNDTDPIEIIKYDDDFNIEQIYVLELQ